MKVLNTFDVNKINAAALGGKISIYSLLVNHDADSMLIGCGVWDRENMPHTNPVKDATPGKVLQISSRHGAMMGQTTALQNIVYPLVRLPWGNYFVGCRTGAMYLMDDRLHVQPLGTAGGGVYGVALSPMLDRFFIGARNGNLYSYDQDWHQHDDFTIADDRLWNLCLDHDQRFVWSACYNRQLYKINLTNGQIVWQQDLGIGATTIVSRLSNGLLAVGALNFKIALLENETLQRIIPTASPVCYLMDLPAKQSFVATGYKGQIWLYDYDGKLTDEFTLDNRENNPIWIAQPQSPETIVFAWANGTIRIIQV
jgi:hypothetical protein